MAKTTNFKVITFLIILVFGIFGSITANGVSKNLKENKLSVSKKIKPLKNSDIKNFKESSIFFKILFYTRKSEINEMKKSLPEVSEEEINVLRKINFKTPNKKNSKNFSKTLKCIALATIFSTIFLLLILYNFKIPFWYDPRQN